MPVTNRAGGDYHVPVKPLTAKDVILPGSSGKAGNGAKDATPPAITELQKVFAAQIKKMQ